MGNIEHCLTKEELSGLTAGGLGTDQLARAKAHMETCELCATANQGYTKSAMAMLAVLDEDVQNMVARKLPKSGVLNGQQILNYVLAGVIVAGGIFWFGRGTNADITKEQAIAALAESEQFEELKAIETVEPQEAQAEEETVEPEPEYIEKAVVEVEEVAVEVQREIRNVNYIPLLALDASKLDKKEEKLQKAKITVNTTYLVEMKTYDYESLYQMEHEQTWRNPSPGVPAEFEHSSEVVHFKKGPDYTTIWTTYEEILETALKEYKRRKYDKALLSLNLLLDDFPDDINGLFYKGLCLYNTKKYDKAVRHMISVAADVNPTFDQEAEWYIALSYLKLGERDIAIDQLNAIVKYDGFYKDKATKKLKMLK